VRLAVAAALVALSAASGALAAPAPLADAVRAGDAKAAEALLARGADVKARDSEGASALLWAVHNQDAAMVRRLLAAGADVKGANDYGATPMSEAALTGDAEILGLLLDAGADVETVNADHQTALMAVARAGKLDAARLLISKGANVNAVETWQGQTALMWATAHGHPEMMTLLIAHGAKVDARSDIHDWERRVTAEPRPKDMFRGGFTPLLFAAREGCVACAKVLLDAGANINLPDPDGVTPLVSALLNLHFGLAEYLINAGADVDRWDLYGRSPLYAAVDVDVLPDGGRPDIPSDETITGVDVAQLLLEKGANPNLQLKLRPPYRNVVFDRGGDTVLSTGTTPLMHAAKAGDVKAVALLLKYKALVDLPTATGVTPLMAAAFMGQGPNPTRGRYKTEEQGAACLKLLIEAGANVNARTPQGQTSLHAAAQRGLNTIITMLAQNGADLTAKDSEQHSAVDYATGIPNSGGFLAPAPQRRPETIALLQQLMAGKQAPPAKTADVRQKVAAR
jgi:ankyrin repeat protein